MINQVGVQLLALYNLVQRDRQYFILALLAGLLCGCVLRRACFRIGCVLAGAMDSSRPVERIDFGGSCGPEVS